MLTPSGGAGSNNTATGVQALFNNTTGIWNTAIGADALFSNSNSNTTATANTATGVFALYSNDAGYSNIASGEQTLYNNTTGTGNTAIGDRALGFNTTGISNTASGIRALYNLSSGSGNLAVGAFAGIALTDGDNNIYVGSDAGAATESNTIRIGTQGTPDRYLYIADIRGTSITGGVAVGVSSSGQLGVMPSSARYKEAIQPMDKASEAILALKPVTFRYKKEIDPERTPEFGLIAEDVEKVNPALVARDAQGKVYTVRYDAVNAMLLNEFLKAHRKMQEQEATIAQLKSTGREQQNEIAVLKAELKEQRALIQKVNLRRERLRTINKTAAV